MSLGRRSALPGRRADFVVLGFVLVLVFVLFLLFIGLLFGDTKLDQQYLQPKCAKNAYPNLRVRVYVKCCSRIRRMSVRRHRDCIVACAALHYFRHALLPFNCHQ